MNIKTYEECIIISAAFGMFKYTNFPMHSVVGIATAYGLDSPGIESRLG